MVIVDTNVLSELMRPSPAKIVLDWVQGHSGRDVFTTAITVAEIRYGIERLPEGRRQQTLRAAAVEIFSAFGDKLLPFDAAAAEQYALVVSDRDCLSRLVWVGVVEHDDGGLAAEFEVDPLQVGRSGQGDLHACPH